MRIVPKLIIHTFLGMLLCYQSAISQNHSNNILQKDKPLSYNGMDGPYLVNDTLYRVNKQNKLIKKVQYNSDSLLVTVDNKDNDQFYVSLESNYKIPKSSFDLPEKMLVLSDIEGKYNAFASLLFSNKVIDKDHNWIFENGHLVLVGDFVDRGKNVTQVLWLIYKLEQQARLKGGEVHFILGNHEVLNFQGDHRYNRNKYIKIAQDISGQQDKSAALKLLYSPRSELGKWLRTKNVIEKIGDYLFVHAGLSTEILDYGLRLKQINRKVRSNYYKDIQQADSIAKFLYGYKGPFWYRGLVNRKSEINKTNTLELERVLSYYKAKKIVVGHTVVKNISTAYEGKLIMIDILHGHKKFSGKTKGLLIENGQEFTIDDLGNKTVLTD